MMKLIIPLAFILPLKHKYFMAPPTLFFVFLVSLASIPAYFFSYSPTTMFDKMSASLISLTLWVSALMILASQKIFNNNQNPSLLIRLTVTLCLFLVAAFATSNLMTFYLAFEASLIPTFLIILSWGYQPERLQASLYLILYTVFASFSLLVTIFMFNSMTMTLFMTTPLTPSFLSLLMGQAQPMWWALTILPFLVKIPMYSMHLWLPKAHVEAPVAGSMILAGVLLKLGGYGLIRMMSLFYQVSPSVKTIVSPIALLGAVAASAICLQQTDLKALIAYSSVGHMGLLIPATLSATSSGWHASLLIMISHGLTSSAMFAMANIAYESFNTRAMILAKGTLAIAPPLTLLWFLIIATNMAAPPSLNLFSEISAFPSSLIFSSFASSLLILLTFLGGAYSLYLYSALNHGHPSIIMNPNTPTPSRNFMIPLLFFIPSMTTPLKLEMFMWPL